MRSGRGRNVFEVLDLVVLGDHRVDARLLVHDGTARIAESGAGRNRGLNVADALGSG